MRKERQLKQREDYQKRLKNLRRSKQDYRLDKEQQNRKK